MAPTNYLKLRGHTWFVRVQIPPHLWKAAGGKREYVKTLKTGDLSEANRRKPPFVAAFMQRIRALERHKPNELGELYEKALAWRNAMDRQKGEVLFEEPDGTPYTAQDEFLCQISDEANEFLETHEEKDVTAFYKIARGEGTPLRSHVDTWLGEQAGQVTGQTISQHRTVVNAFIAWAGDGELIEDVGRKRAGEYVSHLLAPTSVLSRTTAKRYVSSLSSFWVWLEARGLARDNPWLRQSTGKKSKRGDAAERGRKQWSDDALIKVLSGHYTPRYTDTLHDLTRLALVTGARLDELCALKVGDVHKREDGWWITIREGKTDAAVREIPVHDSAAHVLAGRCKKADKFIFEGLVAGGPDNKRSWNVSKAFGHYTRKLDLGKNRQVFHALRNTFTEAMEAAEVPESTTKLLIGHARQSLTYGLYSKGQRVQLRDAINKLHYSSGVMRLIRETTGVRQPPPNSTKVKVDTKVAAQHAKKRRRSR
jgi:integrase